MDNILDVFNSDAFGVVSMTDSINKIPFVPGLAGQIIDWQEEGVPTTSIMLEEIAGELRLINPTPRGGKGQTTGKDRRTARTLLIPHYQIDDAIYADEVQGVREFGRPANVVRTVQGVVTNRMTQHVQWGLDPTLEYQRIGAIKGVILNGDGTTLYNLFTEFGVSQAAEVAFDLEAGSPGSGALFKKCKVVTRTMSKEMGGVPLVGVGALCSDSFYDALTAHKEVRETYLSQQEASQLRNDVGRAYDSFRFGNITWYNYRGEVGGTKFIDDDKAHFFPMGTPGLWRTVYGPADYIETVNTPGLPRYAKQFKMPNDKGVNLEVQSNALSYCKRPATLMKGKLGA